MRETNERTLVSFDWAMKNILRDKANFDILEGFLSTLLGEEIRVLSLLESEANQEHELDKYNRVDLLAVDGSETIFVVEIQYSWQPSYLKRLLYGTSKLVVENVILGQSFDNVRKVISISILYFLFGESQDDYLYYGKTAFYGMNSRKQLAVDMTKSPKERHVSPKSASDHTKAFNIFPEYYLIEVEHFQNVIQQPIDEWIYLFKNAQVKEDFRSKNIQSAKEKLTLLQMSEEERNAYENFLVGRANVFDMLEARYNQGKEEEKRENAGKMRMKGLESALIAEITGLSEAEILAL